MPWNWCRWSCHCAPTWIFWTSLGIILKLDFCRKILRICLGLLWSMASDTCHPSWGSSVSSNSYSRLCIASTKILGIFLDSFFHWKYRVIHDSRRLGIFGAWRHQWRISFEGGQGGISRKNCWLWCWQKLGDFFGIWNNCRLFKLFILTFFAFLGT